MVRKWFVVAATSCALVVTARCDVNIEWVASAGFVWTAGDASLLGDASGNSALVQLIWSLDGVADAADSSTANYLTGDDVLLDSFVFTENGTLGDADDYAYWSTPENYTAVPDPGGYVYGRIFQDNSVDTDDWYFTGSVDAVTDWNPDKEPLDPAQAYEFNFDTANGDYIDGAYGGQVVPEPGTWALFALGAVVVGLHRRRRK